MWLVSSCAHQSHISEMSSFLRYVVSITLSSIIALALYSMSRYSTQGSVDVVISIIITNIGAVSMSVTFESVSHKCWSQMLVTNMTEGQKFIST